MNQLFSQSPRHVGRNCEADKDLATPRDTNLAVNHNELGKNLYQSTTGVAMVDRGVRLQEVLETSVTQAGGPFLSADNSGRDSFAQPERIADCQTDVANPDFVRVPQGKHRKAAGANFQDSQIARSIRANQLGRIGTP